MFLRFIVHLWPVVQRLGTRHMWTAETKESFGDPTWVGAEHGKPTP